MDINQAVAENIHRIRKTEKLSMDRAAELSGVSKSMWGQIERGGVNPTISVLQKIAEGLRVPLSELIAHDEAPTVCVYRTLETGSVRLYGGTVIRYPLFPLDDYARCESSQLDIFISGSYEPQDHIPGSQIYLTVLSGTLEVQAGEDAWVLEGRDSVRLAGELSWRCRNAGNTTVHMIERVYYPKRQ